MKVVFGPGTFLNEAVGEISDQLQAASTQQKAQSQKAGDAAYQLARARGRGRTKAQARALGQQAAQLVTAKFTAQVVGLALRYGLTSAPSLNDPRFVSKLVFDDTRPAGTPKARFASIFPGSQGALIQVRLKPASASGRAARRSPTSARRRRCRTGASRPAATR